MKIEKIKIGAVIPVQQYGNIQPEIEISSEDKGEDLIAVGMDVIKDLFSRYSEKGGLTEHDVVLSKLTKKSFNEDKVDIEFEPVNHTYNHNGKLLIGVTDYIKRFYKPFDEDTISSVLESKWGVPQQTIRELWKWNGEITSDLGTLIDRTLEYFDKFRETGELISSQKGEERNYALPKHPILTPIVEEFYKLIEGQKGKVKTQVLISDIESGICGQADRVLIIDEEKKICRIQDYKVNINAEEKDKSHKVLAPFDSLSPTKLSKYQLQTSIYANMMQKSGWVVEGIDIYVYESNWKHFELPVLKVI